MRRGKLRGIGKQVYHRCQAVLGQWRLSDQVIYMRCDEISIHCASRKFRSLEQFGKKAGISLYGPYVSCTARCVEISYSFITRLRMGNQLGNHWVVIRRNVIALLHACFDARAA